MTMIKYQTKYGTTLDIDTDLFFKLTDEELEEYVDTQFGSYVDPLLAKSPSGVEQVSVEGWDEIID